MTERRSGALEGERMLSQMFPEYQGAYTTQWGAYKTWQSSPSVPNAVWNETYFDLSGYELDDLTLFPMGATMQDPGIYSAATQAGEPIQVPVQVLDIISQDRLSPGGVFGDLAINNVPGMMESDEDWVQMVWGQYRLMMPQATYGANPSVFLSASGGLFGSGSPTTAAKLWFYRFVIINGPNTQGDTLNIPASRFVLNAIIGKEPTAEFMMRQKRSYELDT